MIRLAIRRPVAVAMAYLAVALLGVASRQRIPIELLPDTQLPRLQIQASWRGASPETVEAFLTSPIEATVQQVRGVERVLSVSREQDGMGYAQIDVEFMRSVDMDFARLDLSERLATLQEELPPTVEPIRLAPYVPPEFSEQRTDFLRYTFTGPLALEALRKHLEDEVRPILAQVEGVAHVEVSGGRDRLIEIELDRARIAALGLEPALVAQRIADLDLVRDAGAVRQGAREWTITIRNRPVSVDDIRAAVITAGGAGTAGAAGSGSGVSGGGTGSGAAATGLVRVADVATVHDGFEEAYRHYRIDGRPAVSFALVKEIGANTVRVADRVKDAVARAAEFAPAGTRYILDEDESREIRRQLSDLRARALVSAGVIFCVLLIFLGSLRSTAVIFATIGFSILIALNLVYFGGYTLNLLTLMGLAMGFGLIVDNSIVVLENVYRRWRAGEVPEDAALSGSREVVLPILTSTATTLIVFVPFVYLQGELRVFYVPLAIVVGFTLLASLAVAFSFIPALASRVLPRSAARAGRADDAGGPPAAVHPRQAATTLPDGTVPESAPLYTHFYAFLIGHILRRPGLAVLVTVLAFAGSFHLFDTYVTRGRLWGGGWGQQTYISINYSLPRGSDLERMDQLVRFFEDRLRLMPEIDRFRTNVNPGYAQTLVTFPEALENTPVPPAIKDQLYAYSLGFSGAEVRVHGYGPSFYGGGGSPPNYSITVHGYNYLKVRDIAEDLGRRLVRQPRIQEVDTNASGRFFDRDRATEFVVEIDRGALARYDVTVGDFVSRMGAAIRGQAGQSSVKIGGEDVDYEVKLEGNRDLDVVAFQDVIVEGRGGTGIRLGDVVTLTQRDVLARITRENQQYERTVAYEFRGPARLGDLIQDQTIAATEVPPGYTVEKADRWRWDVEEQAQVYLVFAVSILLVYMVTAALFESLVLPLCVLLTVPMALIGVFLIFFYTGASFTREAYIGVIMMGGIVVNNAILLVDQINRARRVRRLPLRRAILAGTLERVRPILMTTATTVLGLLPLVLFSSGADANIWNALAYALVGGLLSSTLFVLTTTPALYLLLQMRWAPVPAPTTRQRPEPPPPGALQPTA